MNSDEAHIIQDKIDSYLNNTMSDAERIRFEQDIEIDADLKESVLLQKSISETIFNNDLSHIEDFSTSKGIDSIHQTLKTEQYKTHIKTIEEAASVYSKKTQKKRFLYLGAAAAAILIFISVLLLPKQNTADALYAEYSNWDELTSYTEQNDLQLTFSKGELLYNTKKYDEAITFFEDYTVDNTNEFYSAGLIYLGASYFKTNQYN